MYKERKTVIQRLSILLGLNTNHNLLDSPPPTPKLEITPPILQFAEPTQILPPFFSLHKHPKTLQNLLFFLSFFSLSFNTLIVPFLFFTLITFACPLRNLQWKTTEK